jgi:hypothetical protein
LQVAKARKQKLKVFRTPIGFHDAYVAAPSQKAALEAWGAGTNLFTAGTAELVTDRTLIEEPLSKPGEVIKRPRGSAKEHMAALGRSGPKGQRGESRTKPGTKDRAKAKPSRAALERAEAALAGVEKQQAEKRGALDREEEALKKRRQALEEKQHRAMERAVEKRDAAEKRYREAMARWDG